MKVIIGGGISGLVFAFYNRDSIVIDEGKNKDDSPFVFIQKNIYTEKLLDDLNIKNINIVNVLITPQLAEKVIENKVQKQREYFGTDKIANIGEGCILKVFAIKESELCNYLKNSILDRIISPAKVSMITDNLVYTEKQSFPYTEIISTIHYKVFEQIYPSWKSGNNIFCQKMIIRKEKTESPDNSIEYYTDGDIIKCVKNSIVGYIGYEMKENCSGTIIEDARFFGKIAPAPKNVLFLGRFATANSHWRIEDSIFVAQQGYLLAKMLEEQKRFDIAVEKVSNVVGTERIQKLILHLHSELSELLREINWKMHKKENKIIKATSILEESIDIIKFVFAILHAFDYTPREIYEMFTNKSEKVWKELLENFYGGV